MSDGEPRELKFEEEHPCVCDDSLVECLDSNFHDLKMDHSGEYEITYQCNGCGCVWTHNIWMVAGADRREILIEPDYSEEEEEEDPCICIPDEPNLNCESCF